MSSLFAALGAPCGTRDDGDPIVLYDRLADRWLISQFVVRQRPLLPGHRHLADGRPHGRLLPLLLHAARHEVQRLPALRRLARRLLHDRHQFNAAGAGRPGRLAFDRTKMLVGDPTASFVYFDLDASIPPSAACSPPTWTGSSPRRPAPPTCSPIPSVTGWGDRRATASALQLPRGLDCPGQLDLHPPRREPRGGLRLRLPTTPNGRSDITQPTRPPPRAP